MQLPEINIVEQGVWRPKFSLDRTPLRFVLYYEIEILHESDGMAVINGEEIDCFEGRVVFAKPGDLRYSNSPKKREFNRDFVRFEVTDDPGGHLVRMMEKIPTAFRVDEGFQSLWSAFMRSSRQSKEDLPRIHSHLLLLQALFYLSEHSGEEGIYRVKCPSSHQQALFRAICYMRDHINENVDVSTIAHAIGYSNSHFSHLFKSYTKSTPYAYYLSLRLKEARHLLLNSSLNISQIAATLSFESVGKFSAAFKRFYGISPTRFRKIYDGAPVEIHEF
ncbi:MAG: helix-turn-helix domain-containing protein [Clostridia bacterium]|nr:helix-turn-helix domain-containing protein [Clostridia bacterium]